MAFTLLPDEIWEQVRPLLPLEPPKPLGGRPRVSDRQCLMGIIFVLQTGMHLQALHELSAAMICAKKLEWL